MVSVYGKDILSHRRGCRIALCEQANSLQPNQQQQKE
ncbi:hypothetical protein PSECIP111951_02668 [Pseudoalteromonas holothuriae]|uniref:Uncharacterized protein n=1 Tax=Pseudoalteromonas holothuriae TaxID=2963714 RepID=A0ABN8URS4_9GAMM|nr:hypothetical protein PSECIP111951_02668 [Pseudoalteromonas sp. CIP111951]